MSKATEGPLGRKATQVHLDPRGFKVTLVSEVQSDRLGQEARRAPRDWPVMSENEAPLGPLAILDPQVHRGHKGMSVNGDPLGQPANRDRRASKACKVIRVNVDRLDPLDQRAIRAIEAFKGPRETPVRLARVDLRAPTA